MLKLSLLEEIGITIKKLRTKYHWSQEKLAEESWVDRGDISLIENGKLNMTMKTFLKLCYALKVPVRKVFC